jgi:hypothetical protein
VFKQILDATEIDQQKIRYLYNDLQLLIQRIMAEKNSVNSLKKRFLFVYFYFLFYLRFEMKLIILKKYFLNLNMNYVNLKNNIDRLMIKFSSEFSNLFI